MEYKIVMRSIRHIHVQFTLICNINGIFKVIHVFEYVYLNTLAIFCLVTQ